jgi:hypothetical protein
MPLAWEGFEWKSYNKTSECVNRDMKEVALTKAIYQEIKYRSVFIVTKFVTCQYKPSFLPKIKYKIKMRNKLHSRHEKLKGKLFICNLFIQKKESNGYDSMWGCDCVCDSVWCCLEWQRQYEKLQRTSFFVHLYFRLFLRGTPDKWDQEVGWLKEGIRQVTQKMSIVMIIREKKYLACLVKEEFDSWICRPFLTYQSFTKCKSVCQ